MTVATGEIPQVFREGYTKARSINPALAAAYVRNTTVGDPPADAAVASLAGFPRQEVHRLIEAGIEQRDDVLRGGTAELRDFFRGLDSPEPEAWFDRELALTGSRAFYRDADLFLMSLIGVGLVDNFATLIARSFMSTGFTTSHSVRRLRSSLKQVIESMIPGGLEPGGDGRRLTIRARLVHAQARYNLVQSGDWDAESYGMPVSAAHVAYAAAAFSSATLLAAAKLGVRLSQRDREGYVHNWRYIGWLMGVPAELLLKNHAEGLELLRVGRICEPVPDVDSIIMAHTLINSGALALGVKDDEERRRQLTEYGYRISRALNGDVLADQLEFPRHRTRGLLLGMRWKRRLDRMLGRISPTARAENFMILLDATELDSLANNYELPDLRYA